MKVLKYIVIMIFILSISGEIPALPRFSIRGGTGDCIDCHVNPTGGNMRNRSGWSFGKNTLAMISPRDDFEMSNKLNENIQFGLDFRGNFLIKMDSSSTKSDFQRMAGSVYTNVDLSEDINIFARYDFIWGIWEAYGVARILPNGSYIKGGSFTPNFGIRIDDHTAYTRGGDLGIISSAGGNVYQGLIYEPRYVESGVEIGGYISDFALITASVGNSRSQAVFLTDPTYTASLQIRPPVSDDIGLFMGGSFATFKKQLFTATGPTYPTVNMFGGFLGFGIGDFTLLGEYDIANDLLFKDTSSTVIMVEAAYKIVKGLEAVVRFDMFDPNSDVDKDQLSRIIIGFEFFPYSFVEIRPQFRIQMEKPSVENNAAVLQLHLWY
jgi:hypothetical protein